VQTEDSGDCVDNNQPGTLQMRQQWRDQGPIEVLSQFRRLSGLRLSAARLDADESAQSLDLRSQVSATDGQGRDRQRSLVQHKSDHLLICDEIRNESGLVVQRCFLNLFGRQHANADKGSIGRIRYLEVNQHLVVGRLQILQLSFEARIVNIAALGNFALRALI
jgi:hypothetical protein